MKIAIFGDIHANLEALEAVLEDARDEGCTEHTCIGDIVGYNANPRECLHRVQALECPVVKGNHDEVASLDTPIEGLNPLAHHALEWTRGALDDEDKEWLRELPLQRPVENFTVVHATLDSPGSWGYVTTKIDAMFSFNYQLTQVCFFGHTHTPGVYVKDATSVEQLQVSSVRIEKNRKYFINVGSTGQPRDGDPRASYAVYDMETGMVTIQRVDYDIETAQYKIKEAELPEMLARRLAIGK